MADGPSTLVRTYTVGPWTVTLTVRAARPGRLRTIVWAFSPVIPGRDMTRAEGERFDALQAALVEELDIDFLIDGGEIAA